MIAVAIDKPTMTVVSVVMDLYYLFRWTFKFACGLGWTVACGSTNTCTSSANLIPWNRLLLLSLNYAQTFYSFKIYIKLGVQNSF